MKKISLVFTVILFLTHTVINAQSWSLLGNSGTVPGTNYIGTNDIQSLIFKTNKLERLRILSNGRVGIGVASPVQRLDVNGNINLTVGSSIYFDNHKVISADFFNQNLFVASGSGLTVTGKNNTAVGNNALYSLTSGERNTAVGTAALFSNTSSQNTAMGYQALANNTSGYSLTAVGSNALTNNSTGTQNTATGNYALNANTTGMGNNSIGYTSLYFNTIGNYNVAMGNQASYFNDAGSDNVAVGTRALYSNVGGSRNIAIGSNTLEAVNSSYNVAIGYGAGAVFSGGYNNVFVGYQARTIYNGLYNSIVIGANASATASNQVTIGNTATTVIRGFVNWTNVSDGRVKKDIKQNVPGLNFINRLNPVTYHLNLDAADKISGITKTPQADEREIAARKEKEAVTYTGFIAQDVEKAAKELGYDFSGVDAAKNERDLYGLRYAEFVVPLIKSVQELSAQTILLKEENLSLIKRIEKIETLLKQDQKKSTMVEGSLEQNSPNPANKATIIKYNLPSSSSNAEIVISDNQGKILKSFHTGKSNKGTIRVDTSELSTGIYYYTLYSGNNMLDTKQMIVTK
jgi:hypothetical protein